MWSQATIQSFCRLVDGETLGVNKYLPNSQAKALDELSGDEFCRNAHRGGTYSRALLWYRYRDFVRGVAQKENHPPILTATGNCRHAARVVPYRRSLTFPTPVPRYDPKSHCRGKPASRWLPYGLNK